MIKLLKDLAEARQLEDLTKKAKQDAVAEFEASAYFQALQVNHAAAVARTNELTEQLRNDAISTFVVDGEKKPEHGGYEVKMSTTVSIPDEAQAREWCFSNFRPALKLDTKTFEKAAKDGNIPAGLASVQEQPKVYIKTDLSKFLEEEVK